MSNVDKGPLKKRIAQRIKAGRIQERMQRFVLAEKGQEGWDKLDMTTQQVAAARILLAKVVPDLKQVEQTIRDERAKTKLEIDARLKSFGLDPSEIWQSIEKH